MAPIVHGLEAKYYKDVQFTYLDIDDPANDAIKRQLGYRVQPEYYLVNAQGEILQKWFGFVRVQDLESALFEQGATD